MATSAPSLTWPPFGRNQMTCGSPGCVATPALLGVPFEQIQRRFASCGLQRLPEVFSHSPKPSGAVSVPALDALVGCCAPGGGVLEGPDSMDLSPKGLSMIHLKCTVGCIANSHGIQCGPPPAFHRALNVPPGPSGPYWRLGPSGHESCGSQQPIPLTIDKRLSVERLKIED
jgi:hypothetical protein